LYNDFVMLNEAQSLKIVDMIVDGASQGRLNRTPCPQR
jgi:hypothetical protein